MGAITAQARPDPSNLIAYLDWLGDRVVALSQERYNERLNASQAALAFGFKRNYLSRRPWRIPNYGANGTTHTRDEWAAWLARPETERRAGWDKMTAAERLPCLRQL